MVSGCAESEWKTNKNIFGPGARQEDELSDVESRILKFMRQRVSQRKISTK